MEPLLALALAEYHLIIVRSTSETRTQRAALALGFPALCFGCAVLCLLSIFERKVGLRKGRMSLLPSPPRWKCARNGGRMLCRRDLRGDASQFVKYLDQFTEVGCAVACR
jgi:hypothetical protein